MAKRLPNDNVASYLIGPAYGVAVLFVIQPFIDVIAQVWPFNFGEAGWRYGTIGIGANFLISVLFGMIALCALAALCGHRRTLLGLAIVSCCAAALALVGALGFLLDALQLRRGVPRDVPQTLRMFDAGVAKAAFKYAVSAAVLGWLALATWRARRAVPAPVADTVEEKPLIGGSQKKDPA